MKAHVTIGTTLEMDIVSVEVIDRPVQDTIVTACYSYVNQNIKDRETLVHNPGTRHMAIWHPNRNISSENADEAMKSMTTVIDGETYKGRPATIEELASYEVLFHEQLKDMILVALGEKVSDGSRECVASRLVDGSERGLYLAAGRVAGLRTVASLSCLKRSQNLSNLVPSTLTLRFFDSLVGSVLWNRLFSCNNIYF
jgi:hypothetical protein